MQFVPKFVPESDEVLREGLKLCQRAEEVTHLTRDDLEEELLQAEWDLKRLQYDYDMLRRTVDGESS